jgi:2Fe-2S ferredoxin
MDVLIKIKDRGSNPWFAGPDRYGYEHHGAVQSLYELPVEGTYGGMAMCASCQCYVLNVTLPEMGDDEEAMLSEAFYVKSNSRLGCQINHWKFRRFRTGVGSREN